jgi:hypothetical protein
MSPECPVASDELLDVRGQSGYPAGVRIILLVGLVIATALCASGCGESRYGGLSRDAARAKADEITGDLRAVVRSGRFDFMAIQKASVSGHEAWKVKFALVTHVSPLAPAHPAPLFCVYVWGAGSTVRTDGSGSSGC